MKRRDALKTGAALVAVPLIITGQEAAWTPVALTPEQSETVETLTELIIPETDTPGAKAAKVYQYIDRFLDAEPAGEKERFVSGLTWLDRHSSEKHNSAFAKLTAPQQIAILTALDSGQDASLEEGQRFFRRIKQMTSRIYYETRAGYQELNKGGVPSTFGCRHENHKA